MSRYRLQSPKCTEARGGSFGYFFSANANQLREICAALKRPPVSESS